MDNIEYVGKAALHYDCYSGKDLYPDGAEDELLNIVSNTEPGDYNKVIDERKSWQLLYHLSEIRGNIVDWFPFSEKDRVLEIGAECGAVTGVLARKAGKVDCIETSKKKSLVNAVRNQQLENVDIYTGDFTDIEKHLTDKYDYITLIGALEYAPRYIKSDNPYTDFLNMVKGHLTDKGKIIIATANKYGLKYWAGCRDEHRRSYYSGIEGYVGDDGVKTFAKSGLEKLLAGCGLGNYKFYYPYPDYKFPLAVYSDEFLPERGTLTNNFRNFDSDRVMIFDESRVFDNLLEDGMFDIFSNSFLVIAGQEG